LHDLMLFFNLVRFICTRKNPNKKAFDLRKSVLSKDRPLKSLTLGLSQAGGRNSTGRQVVFHRGGGHKRLFRAVHFHPFSTDSLPLNTNIHARVVKMEYDPNRSSWLNLMELENSSVFEPKKHKFFYTLATDGVTVGSIRISGPNAPAKNGNILPLKSIPTGSWIHSIELRPGDGAKLVRSAGVRAKLVRSDTGDKHSLVRLPSGQRIKVNYDCYATIGSVSNILHKHRVLRKAGVSRWLSRRPITRGVAKNPVDHPHGGRTKGGVRPKTPWGKLTRGVPTRSKRKPLLLKK
jgi:large subunit ribosomal protein L2